MGVEQQLISATTVVHKVNQVALAIKRSLSKLEQGWMEGEIRQINLAASGHCYFELADEEASLSCIIWKSQLPYCKPLPKIGDLVQAHYSKVDFYSRTGKLSLIIDELHPTGDGELLRRRQAALERLKQEGFCDPERKKKLPAFPRKIGVISGEGSDAKADVLKAIKTRMPSQDVIFVPAVVQGVNAVASMIDAIGVLQTIETVDVLIIARGGGSANDLAAFDDERLCRAIFACSIPVITSIGHTQDRPNCDYVASAYATVPAKAAELATHYSRDELLERIGAYSLSLSHAVDEFNAKIEEIKEAEISASIKKKLSDFYELLEKLDKDNTASVYDTISRYHEGLAHHSKLLRAIIKQALLYSPDSASLDVISVQIKAGYHRFRRDKNSYEKAFIRLSAQAKQSSRRSISKRIEEIERSLALINAKDLRTQGWIVAENIYGQAITTTKDLQLGDTLNLQLEDGQVAVAVQQIRKG